MRKLEKPFLGLPQFGLRAWMMSAMHSFYRKVQVYKEEELPLGKKPILFASNHQNAFMDALVVIATCGTVPVFLTRADIFQSDFLFGVLKFLRMLPIFRQRDGKDSMKKNEEVFDMCVELLKDNDNMGIFPEGNHGRRPRLRVLKKGLARIALEAESRNNFELDVQIIPVGIYYSDHLKDNSDVMVSYGKPIDVINYQEEYESNPVKTYVSLTNEVRSRLESLMIHIPNQKYIESIEALQNMFGESIMLQNGENPRDLRARLHSDQKFLATLDAFIKEDEQAAEALDLKVKNYQSGINDLGLEDKFVANTSVTKSGLLLRILRLILSFPFYLYGAVNSLLIDLPTKKIVGLFKDDHFHASMAMLARMFLKPFVYALQGGIVWAIFGNFWLALAYVVSIEVSRNIARRWRVFWKDVMGRWKVDRLRQRKSSDFAEMVTLRGEIEGILLERDSVASEDEIGIA